MKSLVEFIIESQNEKFSDDEFNKVLDIFPEDKFETKIVDERGNQYITFYVSKDSLEENNWHIPDSKQYADISVAPHANWTIKNDDMKVTISKPNGLNGKLKVTQQRGKAHNKNTYLGKNNKGLDTIDDALAYVLKTLTK